MDRTLNRAKRRNKRRGQRNSEAWRRFSLDGETCRFCPHDETLHLMSSGQPHFYQPATQDEIDDACQKLYRHDLPDGGSVLVKRVTVAKSAELITLFCAACAEALGTGQVMCYHRTLGVGEVIGVGVNNHNTKGDLP